MDTVRDIEVEGLPARLYRPRAEPSPLILYLHAGGWTVGSVASADRLCRRLAAAADAAVLSLEYRLAPEHPWPASVDDAVTTMRWIARRPEELEGLGPWGALGDSAGGTLVTLACQRLRSKDPAALPAVQALIYANTDLTGSHPSMRENAEGGGLDPKVVRWFNSQWVADESRWGDEGVSPLAAADLSAMPPALIVSAERDPLRDELEAYAKHLRQAGNEVMSRREHGMIHNFLQMDEASPAAAAAADRIGRELGELIRSTGPSSSVQ
ncbi:MAG: alpha/beta hydrolase [Actinobacteria bacterium]|nr:alpha/beta hydrolase [Actinomycetota bacterium]